MSRLEFITNKPEKGKLKKKPSYKNKKKGQLLKELENAHFEIAKLKFKNLELKKDKEELEENKYE